MGVITDINIAHQLHLIVLLAMLSASILQAIL